MDSLHFTIRSKNQGPFRLRFAGCFRLQDKDGADISPRGRKARAIIAYLASQPGERVPRTRLMELFWGDRGDRQARDSLRHALAEIRAVTGNFLQSRQEHLWIDADSFVEEGAPASVSEILEDLDDITPEFDEWLNSIRERRAAETWDRLQNHIEMLLEQGRGAVAMPLIEQMRHMSPYNEDWLRLALRAEYEAGHPAGIKQKFNEFAEALRADLDVAPAAETRVLRDRLLRDLSVEVSGPRVV